MNRRDLIRGGVAAGAAALVDNVVIRPAAAADAKEEVHGRIQQSVVFWCFNVAGEKWNIEKTCEVARELKCKSVEIVGPEHWDTLKKHKLVCALAPNGMPGAPFMKGFNNHKYHEEVIGRTSK